MRIAYVINSVEGGGAAFPIPDIVDLMRDNGHEIAIFALSPRDRRATSRITATGVALSVREGGSRDHVSAYRWLSRQVLAWQPDLIWTSLTRATILGQIFAVRHNLPAVHWQHNAYLKRANIALLRCVKSWAALWIADSQCVAQITRRRLSIDTGCLACWPIFHVDPAAYFRSGSLPDAPVRIGSLGRLHHSKGYGLLIEAASRLTRRDGIPPFIVEIAGDGPERTQLQELIQRLNAPVRLLGHVDDTKTFLGNLHVYVQPSRWEGFCIAAHEAMASGLPIIATAVGEMAHSIRPEMGISIPHPDVGSLEEALARLICDPQGRRAMGDASRADMIRRFGADQFRRDGLSVLRRLEELVGSRL